MQTYINESGRTVIVQYPGHDDRRYHIGAEPTTYDVFTHDPILCPDCTAQMQEAPSAGQPGQEVYRCPWTSSARYEVEHNDPTLLVLSCGWPKGRTKH